jgi:hypothetical protein
MVFLVTYDLHNPQRDYAPVHAAIKALGAWCHCLESTWLVESSRSVGQIRDEVKAAADSNDTILVLPIGGSWASYNLPADRVSWLHRHVADYSKV